MVVNGRWAAGGVVVVGIFIPTTSVARGEAEDRRAILRRDAQSGHFSRIRYPRHRGPGTARSGNYRAGTGGGVVSSAQERKEYHTRPRLQAELDEAAQRADPRAHGERLPRDGCRR